MWDFDLTQTMGAMRKTAPFILFRMMVYFGIALGYIIATGVGGAIGYGFTSFADEPGSGAGIGALFGFGAASGVLYWFREYILYLVKAGHIAVLVQVMDGKDLPGGRGQIDCATAMVKERFKEASVLFAIDQLIKGILKVVNSVIYSIATFLPIPGLQNLARFINAVLNASLTYVDEIILAYNIRNESDNAWESSRAALVLYAQNYKSMVKNAIWLALFMWVLTLIIFVIMVTPTFAIMSIFPGQGGFWTFVIAFIFAWAFKAALLEPFAIYALMQAYFKVVEGQEPNPEWDEKLSKVSKQFRELKDKALSAVGGGTTTPAPSEDTPPPQITS